jgi:hypothetical protein
LEDYTKRGSRRRVNFGRTDDRKLLSNSPREMLEHTGADERRHRES